ncbi:MAG TPA: ATP-binding protein [Terracidiphilus sp.]|jgi:signal transduction histidine kinase
MLAAKSPFRIFNQSLKVDTRSPEVEISRPGPAVHASMPERMRAQDPERAQSLLRCVQELISNTLKHAQASNLWITIDTCNDMLRVDANDDGCGGKESIKLGFGLSGMRDRSER